MSYLASEGTRYPFQQVQYGNDGAVGGVYAFNATASQTYTQGVLTTIVSQVLPVGTYLVVLNMYCSSFTGAVSAFQANVNLGTTPIIEISPGATATSYYEYAYVSGSCIVASDGYSAISVKVIGDTTDAGAYYLSLIPSGGAPPSNPTSVVQITRIA
jgi:hypothetical protein